MANEGSEIEWIEGMIIEVMLTKGRNDIFGGFGTIFQGAPRTIEYGPDGIQSAPGTVEYAHGSIQNTIDTINARLIASKAHLVLSKPSQEPYSKAHLTPKSKVHLVPSKAHLDTGQVNRKGRRLARQEAESALAPSNIADMTGPSWRLANTVPPVGRWVGYFLDLLAGVGFFFLLGVSTPIYGQRKYAWVQCAAPYWHSPMSAYPLTSRTI